MRLGFHEARAGRLRTSLTCPSCGSRGTRSSRRHYEGPWSLICHVRPMKCGECGIYFAVSTKSSAGRLGDDPVDPQASESARVNPESPSGAGQHGGPGSPVRAGACPRCGSDSVRPAVPGPLESFVSRFHSKDLYRCLNCNASFKRANPAKLLAMSLAFLVLLFGLTYLALAGLHRLPRRPETSPKVKGSQLPPEPPPVLRR